MIVPIALVAAALATAPVAALAEDYRVMGEDERAISLIESTIRTDSDGHRETVYYFGFSEPISGPGGTQVVSGTILFDCAGARYKVGATAIFKADMTLVERHEPRFAWREIVAESPFSRARDYACKGTPLPKADSGDIKSILVGYLARRAAVAPPTPEPTPAPEAAPPPAPEPTPAPEVPADPTR
ncbi:MAG: hypothetical protein HY859_10045 [Caulobacterales bacterium]|nr:hypothetical protein [Caulobacterales bacterium]